MPILNPQGKTVGLIDCESWRPNFFDDLRVGIIAKCALDLGAAESALKIAT